MDVDIEALFECSRVGAGYGEAVVFVGRYEFVYDVLLASGGCELCARTGVLDGQRC